MRILPTNAKARLFRSGENEQVLDLIIKSHGQLWAIPNKKASLTRL